jgi:hypothetical protein
MTSDLHIGQQVIDMLRDHLTDALSELASSRAHAHDLQETYVIEHRTSQQTIVDEKTSS